MLRTYHSLRLGIAYVGVMLPWVLWIGGCLRGVGALQSSMSAYYHTSMRDVFVGVLVALGLLLYLYKGFSPKENRALNCAGVLAIGVAIFPTVRVGEQRGMIGIVHAVCAVAFFACIAYVSIFRAVDTLSLMKDGGRAKQLRVAYQVLGGSMVLFPIAAVLLSTAFEPASDWMVFFAEAAGVVAFAAFWFVKSEEMRTSKADQLAADGQLLIEAPVAATAAARLRAPFSLIRAEPAVARTEMAAALREKRAREEKA